jgi:dihydroorotate dehydrogenase (NAD+) catalytic subunit
MPQLFYDWTKTFDENVADGPYFDTIPTLVRSGEPEFTFLGFPIYLPFGIAAGPLPTGKHVKAAFDWGYDVVHYKTMRTVPFPANPFPNVIPIDVEGDITLEAADKGLTLRDDFPTDISKLVITNSFGNPGLGPDFWVEDMKKAVVSAGNGQVMVASTFGTAREGMSSEDFWQDFADASKMAVGTGAKIIELNLSCPNVMGEGIVCYTPDAVIGICKRTREAIGDTPLMIKLGYFSDKQQTLLEHIMAEVNHYIDAVALINTIPAKIYNKQGGQALPGEGRLTSGLCGAGIKWAGLDMVKRLGALRKEKNYTYEIAGIGGVMTPDDFFEYREAGAELVQACTGPMWNPNLAAEINQSLRSQAR